MTDAIVSGVAERIIALIEEQARYHIDLLRGAEKEVRRLATELRTVRNVLEDAERRRFREKAVTYWLVKLEQISYEMEDVLDEWSYAIRKIEVERDGYEDAAAAGTARRRNVWSCIPSSSSCLCFKKGAVRHRIAIKILEVKELLDEVLREKDRYNFVVSSPAADPLPKPWRLQSTSSVELEKVQGREIDRDNIVRKLVADGGDCSVVSIVGVGGLGKTTLAQLVYHDSRVKECFELRIWICVSDPFDEAEIARGIIESVKGSRPADTNRLEQLLLDLRGCISGKKFLLVLDDVWNEDYAKWEPLNINLKCGAAGSKILATTRNEKVARILGMSEEGMYRPRELTTEECWLLLRRISLSGRSEEECEKFEEIGREIVSKCKGLPLAASVLGSLLRFKDSLEEWENVLASEIWQLEEAEVQLFPHLFLSYNELSPALQHCFSYCAIFPKDSRIDVEKLIEKWIALGYLGSDVENVGDMELKGREYFNNLAMRSLFQDVEEEESKLDGQMISCKMHDIVHDFARFLRKDVSSVRLEIGLKMAACQSCNFSLVSSVKTYRSFLQLPYLSYHPYICDCLTSLRALGIAKSSYGNPHEIERLIHLRWLDLTSNDLSRESITTICKLYKLQFLRVRSCNLQEVPTEIGNLIQLRHLDLSWNKALKELPESICGLRELQILKIGACKKISRLPEGIDGLVNLKHFHNLVTGIQKLPQGVARLINLRTLRQFHGGRGWGEFGWLKNLNHLSGSLLLNVRLSNIVVEDVQEAEVRKKVHLRALDVRFYEDGIDEKNDVMWMNVLEAMEPHPRLQMLIVDGFRGSRLAGWMSSPLFQLRSITLSFFDRMSSLPPLGKLPCLEEVEVFEMEGLQFVGREFLGLTGDVATQSSSSSLPNIIVAFPKLKKLNFEYCPNWEEWEDITVEEEQDASMTLMPHLTELVLGGCGRLMMLPHRLLGKKAVSLEYADVSGSIVRFEGKEGVSVASGLKSADSTESDEDTEKSSKRKRKNQYRGILQL